MQYMPISFPSFPSCLSDSLARSLWNTSDLDPADVRSYRPISNLTVISKLLERIVSSQLVKYLKDNGLLPDLQSAYRAMQSTETAVLKVLSDLLLSLDPGNLAMLTLLDPSAAFDSVDHDTLLQRLYKSYGLQGSVFDWFASYLRGRVQQSACLQLVQHHPRSFRSSTGFGLRTDPVPLLHGWSTPVSETSPAYTSRLRRRHSDLRVLSARRFCCILWEAIRLRRHGIGQPAST